MRATRVLVVANRTATTPWLLDEIERRSDEVLVSTRPPSGPKWLNPHPLRWLDELDVPVTTVFLRQRARLERGVVKVRWDDSGP